MAKHAGDDRGRLGRILRVVSSTAVGLVLAGAAPSPAAAREPVAGAFVFPVGDPLDFTKPHEGEPSGFYVSDSYLVVRNGRRGQRTHKGVDLANGRGGSPVRAIGSGTVVVSDAKARIKVRKPRRVKSTRVVNGKRVVRWTTKTRTSWKWRTGWGNYVVIRHTLSDGQTVHSLYAHLKSGSILVQRGDVVAAGETIAQVGNTGRASSPHLHLEIRKAIPDPSAGDDFDPEDAADATVQDRTFALLATVDPVSFLEQHVRRFEDLEPRSWQARYALAACRDGIVAGDHDRFDPDDSITRSDFYGAIASAFGIGTPSGQSFSALRASLAEAGILGPTERGEHAGDNLKRSEALEILLRCLDRSKAQGRNLGSFAREKLCTDFNRVFAGPDAAERADREARTAALAETAARRKAAEAEYERALKARKAKGTAARKRVQRPVVKPVAPTPRLDPGFEALAQSERNLTRAEACLLLASSFRLGSERLSSLEQAAARVATASSGVASP